MTSSVLSVLAPNAIAFATPLVLAALGGYCCEKSGVVNIALEGKMLMAACITVLIGSAYENAYIGLMAGIIAAVLLAVVHWVLTQSFRVDAVVSGMAINALAYGGTNFLYEKGIDPARAASVPFLSIRLYYGLALIIPIALWAYTRWTRGGLRLSAVGNDPDKARSMGVSPSRIRFNALAMTGLLCGLSGAFIATNTSGFVDNMTSGRGYIALAALILGGWRPIPTAIACIAFGILQALQITLQGTPVMGVSVPSEAWNAMPYIITVVALAGVTVKNRAPAGQSKH
jgi:simple sugar transport system permease protein